ncbi:MAG: hypothetical protein RLZZ371_1894 [Pseudomonadota bacterium]
MRVLLAPMPAALRLQLRRLLRGVPGIDLVGQILGDRPDVDIVRQTNAQCVLLDMASATEQMLREFMAGAPELKCLVLYTVKYHGACASMRDPSLGCLERPVLLDDEPLDGEFARQLRQRLGAVGSPFKAQDSGKDVPSTSPAPTQRAQRHFDVLAVGASTGGPQALQVFFGGLARAARPLTFPILVTQHMGEGFVAALAHSLQENTGIPTVEAEHGMLLLPGHAYLAPGGRHLRMARQGQHAVCRLDNGPPENFCKPSVDVMLRSLSDLVSLRVLVVMLTGMGQDGLLGCQGLHARGSVILAQDKASSVVWGMPGAVAQAGICKAVLPLEQLAPQVLKLAGNS